MHRSTENRNYYSDHRTQARNRNNYLIVDDESMNCVIDLDHDKFHDDDGNKIKVPIEYDVCPTCDGKGKHVDPNIDANGIPQSRFQRDPEFRREYERGTYDVQCYECDGKRVVPRPVAYNSRQEVVVEAYHKTLVEKREHKRTRMAEKSMGA